MSSLWIIPDPYKHRAMRMNGVPERICTGQASDEERFT
ncbi:MAG: glucuronate isomerase, partial [Clostridiaceae bacterium]|nr:glucuronate isomerase [Clostridiaceae bacterium]